MLLRHLLLLLAVRWGGQPVAVVAVAAQYLQQALATALLQPPLGAARHVGALLGLEEEAEAGGERRRRVAAIPIPIPRRGRRHRVAIAAARAERRQDGLPQYPSRMIATSTAIAIAATVLRSTSADHVPQIGLEDLAEDRVGVFLALRCTVLLVQRRQVGAARGQPAGAGGDAGLGGQAGRRRHWWHGFCWENEQARKPGNRKG